MVAGLTLAALNQMDCAAFTAALGSIFEDTPAVAAAVWLQRPFATVADLHGAMVAVVQGWPRDRQLALICAHPELGAQQVMAAASVAEQQSRGLTDLAPEQAQRLADLNRAYREKFGFPFVIAVRNHSREGIFAALEQRLQGDLPGEHQQALREIAAIAHFRLLALLGDTQP